MKPLDRGLNVAVMHIASRLFPCGFDVSEHAPQTYDELLAQLATGRMVVWSGASDGTIFADPEVNWCFRAWHDWCHWKGQHLFTLLGESAVYRMQSEHLRVVYGPGERLERWKKILHAEIIGQTLYDLKYGGFPENQYEFTARLVADT